MEGCCQNIMWSRGQHSTAGAGNVGFGQLSLPGSLVLLGRMCTKAGLEALRCTSLPGGRRCSAAGLALSSVPSLSNMKVWMGLPWCMAANLRRQTRSSCWNVATI